MARLVIQFPGKEKVYINGLVLGETNEVIRLNPGDYTVKLEGDFTEPDQLFFKSS